MRCGAWASASIRRLPRKRAVDGLEAELDDLERTLRDAMAEAASREDRAAAQKKLERLRQELRL